MTAVDFEKQFVTDIFTSETKCLVKRAARSSDALILIEHQERVTNGIDDGVRERERDSDRNIDEWRVLRLCRSQHMSFPPRFRTRPIVRKFSSSWRKRRDA